MASVHVTSNGSRLGQAITIRDFQLIADEPLTAGGNDAGPMPLEWVLAGLGACKSITVQMYAQRKGWVLQQVSIDLSYQNLGDRHRIDVQMSLEGDLDYEQRQRLRQIADRCPVHRLLTGNVEIQTALVPEVQAE
jgi:putative redox protein